MNNLIQLLIISISLSLDALSVSVAGGIKTQKSKVKDALKVAFFFGIFQAIMPLIGYFIGKNLESIISSIDHWVAFFLLFIIGLKMIIEAFQNKEEKEKINILNN
jgi:putative Mn2+ efflux pump MntP